MGERITGGGAVGNGMHAERGSERKNGHMWVNEWDRACVQKYDKDHQSPKQRSHT